MQFLHYITDFKFKALQPIVIILVTVKEVRQRLSVTAVNIGNNMAINTLSVVNGRTSDCP